MVARNGLPEFRWREAGTRVITLQDFFCYFVQRGWFWLDRQRCFSNARLDVFELFLLRLV